MFYIYLYFLKGSCESLFTNMIVLLTQDSNVMVSCIPTVTIYLSKIWYIRLDSIDKNIVNHIHYSFTNLVSATWASQWQWGVFGALWLSLHVCCMIHQDFHNLFVTCCCCQDQRCEPLLIPMFCKRQTKLRTTVKC